jgi:uncharacterized membrane protein YcaP (DUF421 family)
MDIDWQRLFVPQTPLLELVLRGSVMYLALFAVLRILVRRHIGSLSLMDLLLIVLIADAAQNAMANEYRSITEGLVLCGTLIAWSCLLEFLAYQSETIARLLEPPPLPVVKNGRLQRRNMRQELLTEDDLMSQLRQHEVSDLAEVALAYIEPDGGIGIVQKTERGETHLPESRRIGRKPCNGRDNGSGLASTDQTRSATPVTPACSAQFAQQ